MAGWREELILCRDVSHIPALLSEDIVGRFEHHEECDTYWGKATDIPPTIDMSHFPDRRWSVAMDIVTRPLKPAVLSIAFGPCRFR